MQVEPYQPRTSPERAVEDAVKDIAAGDLKVCRYDVCPIGGYQGDFFALLERFELRGVYWTGATVAYAKAYNRVIDRELRRRHGLRYLAVRSKIMPARDASRWVGDVANDAPEL